MASIAGTKAVSLEARGSKKPKVMRLVEMLRKNRNAVENRMNGAKYVTIVFEVSDPQKFEQEHKQFFEFPREESAPFRVVAWSADHEIRRCELYEESTERAEDLYELHDTMERIASHTAIGSVQSLEELREEPDACSPSPW